MVFYVVLFFILISYLISYIVYLTFYSISYTNNTSLTYYYHTYLTYMQIKAKIMSESQESKVRVGYPGGIEVTERKKIKDVIVEMTNASAGSGSA